MTFHLLSKALSDAILTGENQIFLSENRLERDALWERGLYLARFFCAATIVDRIIELANGAKLIFVLADSRTIAGYSGNAYALNCFDETNFSHVMSLMTGWTALKKHRAVFFSVDEN